MADRAARLLLLALAAGGAVPGAAQPPATPLRFGAFVARFAPDGTCALEAQGRATFQGSWRADGDTLVLKTTGGEQGCDGEARYTFRKQGAGVSFELVGDECRFRRMILDRS